MILRNLLLALTLLLSAASVHALTEITGTTPGGAAYRIAVPDGWQPGHPLVLVQHAYSHSRVTAPTLGALRDTQLAQGFAVAASGYRQGGWALFTALDDNAELIDAFTARFGAPGSLYATGQKMGGLVALKLAEDPRFRDRTRGVLTTCPVVGGVEHWDKMFDVRLILDMVCAGVSGRPPIGSEPYPWATNLAHIPPGLREFDTQVGDFSQANYCLGLGAVDVVPQAGWEERQALVKSLTRIDDNNALLAHISYAVFGLGDLVRAPDKFNGLNPFFNEVADLHVGSRRIRYLPTQFDNAIRRVRQGTGQEDLFARFDFELNSSLDGTATARIVDLHTSLDELAEDRHQTFLRTVYREDYPAGRVGTTIWETAPSDCGLSSAEVHAGWDVLLNPVSTETDIAGSCVARQALGHAGPCRFQPPSPPTRQFTELRTREIFAAPQRSEIPLPSSGFWFDPLRSGEGIVVEELGLSIGAAKFMPADRRAVLVTWYTFAPPGDPAPGPRWLTGVGIQSGQGVHVPSMTLTRGARFGSAFDPADVERQEWGSLSLVVDTARNMRIRYDGPEGWEGSVRAMAPIALIDFPDIPLPCCFGPAFSPPPPNSPPDSGFASGTYFNPARDGEGIQLHVLEGAEATRKRAVMVFYTYDTRGNQLWLVGSNDNVPASGGEITFSVQRAQGGVFGDTFDPAAIERIDWGTVTVTLFPATSLVGSPTFVATALRWNAIEPEYGNGGYALTRLTRPSVYGSRNGIF